ncbi:class I SAM-dependent methyltransferase [Sporanaerobacter acetigenes]|uniref:Methyltransferase domain-containing protein n=2 Tax=Sporanaerobacter acetigenes TaxID=165813 RepID=A0A1M5Z7R5_9FIRM|nr:class I SAM-dependent methyltransferase [Sporanaerobacter acetigenes]SHI20241.1 Methyltransferase domain-containing protein [Sporanaerobacter acetigenes DSM 13106]
MKLNYNKISKQYDDVREADVELINKFLEEITFDEETKILDFGCGTGNYTDKIKRLTNADVYGIEPSDGMRKKAITKNNKIIYKKGNHENISFPDNFFNFIYMTDVIHHIPDIDVMFKEFKRILKKGGKICIETESHEQIEKRFYVKYFPSTAIIDKARYPKINDIKNIVEENGLIFIKSLTIGDASERTVDKKFLELVEKKGYSMFHLIPEKEFENGLHELKKDLKEESFKVETSGDTLIWIEKI